MRVGACGSLFGIVAGFILIRGKAMRANRTSILALALLSLAYSSLCRAAEWHDPSPHRVQFVTVEPGVNLEVLDWGGNGRALVLLPGHQSAHIFDDIAIKLSKFSHVYGVTPRGIGASSHPESGYDAQRLAQDVLEVLSRLNIDKPVLAGHSVGGQTMNVLGPQHSSRFAGFVYLNSGEDGTLGPEIWKRIKLDPAQVNAARAKLPAAMRDPPPPPVGKSFADLQKWQKLVHGVAFPKSELQQLYATNPDGTAGKYLVPKSLRDTVAKNLQRPDYSGIPLPSLALMALPTPFEQEIKRYEPVADFEEEAMREVHAADLAIAEEHIQELEKILNIQILEVVGANYYIWLSNEKEVVQHMQRFLTKISSEELAAARATKEVGTGYAEEVFEVRDGISPPRIKHQTEPEFPEAERRKNRQGQVTIRAIVGTDGRAHNPRVIRSMNPEFDQQALTTINQWIFEPAMKDGRRVAVYITVDMAFRLY